MSQIKKPEKKEQIPEECRCAIKDTTCSHCRDINSYNQACDEWEKYHNWYVDWYVENILNVFGKSMKDYTLKKDKR